MSTKSIPLPRPRATLPIASTAPTISGTTFVLHKNGVPMARIVPEERKPRTGLEIAAALRVALKDVHLGEEEAMAWLHDIEEARKIIEKRRTTS